MYYTLQITVEAAKDMPASLHRPISVETHTNFKSNVNDDEIDMVAEAFKAQIKQLLIAMTRGT